MPSRLHFSMSITNFLCMYEEIISKLGPIFEKNISSSLAEIDFEREVGLLATFDK